MLDRLTTPYGEECTGIDEAKEDTEEHEATVDEDPIKRFPWRIEVFRMIYDRSLGLVDGGPARLALWLALARNLTVPKTQSTFTF